GRLAPRPAGHRWLILLVLIALLYIWFNIQANTYWSVVLTVPGCLLIASLFSDYTVANWRAAFWSGLIIGGALLFCPGVREIAKYLTTDPRYNAARSVKPLVAAPILYRMPQFGPHLKYYTRMAGPRF